VESVINGAVIRHRGRVEGIIDAGYVACPDVGIPDGEGNSYYHQDDHERLEKAIGLHFSTFLNDMNEFLVDPVYRDRWSDKTAYFYEQHGS